LSYCVVPFCDAIFITNWYATWGLQLDSKDVQGRVGMKMETNMVQSLHHSQWKHPTFHFKHVKHTFEYILLFTCLCYLFPFICVLYSKIYGLQESNFHCSLLVFNHDAHELI